MNMTLVEHLIELRKRLIISFLTFVACFGLSYPFSQTVFDFLLQPLATALQETEGRRLIYTHMAEAFLVYIKVSLFMGLFLSFPIIACQIWIFVAPGLYKNEKRAILPFFIVTPLLFLLGATFVYYFIIPNAWKFFLSYESVGHLTQLPIQLEAKANEYLSLTMQLIIAFGLCFQLPVLMLLLAKIGIISSQTLKAKRKYSFVGILILSAFLTPPDVLSMIGLAVPMYGLYELSIALVRLTERKKEASL